MTLLEKRLCQNSNVVNNKKKEKTKKKSDEHLVNLPSKQNRTLKHQQPKTKLNQLYD